MKTSFTIGTAGIFLGLILLCSCATEPSARRSLPADQPINKEAGRGGNLIVTVQLDNGRKLPFAVDTGAGGTLLDKSLSPQLGKSLGTVAVYSPFTGGTSTNNYYTSPKLYVGGAPLMMTGTSIVTWDLRGPLALPGRPIWGILGIDVLEHYCIQLDFAAGKMRFLDDQHADKSMWGQPFPIAPLSADDGRPAVAGNLFGARDAHSLIDSGFIGDGSLMPKYFQLWTNQVVAPANGEVRSPDGVFGGKKYPFVNLSEKDWPSDAIGLNFLARHLVTLDFPNHTLYLRCQSIGPLTNPKLAAFRPIPDKEPNVTAHLHAMIQDWIDGTEHADDYTASAWKKLLSKQKEIQALTKRVGDIVSLTLVERRGMFGRRRSYSYRMEFTNATLRAQFVLNGQNKLTSGNLQVVAWKAPAD